MQSVARRHPGDCAPVQPLSQRLLAGRVVDSNILERLGYIHVTVDGVGERDREDSLGEVALELAREENYDGAPEAVGHNGDRSCAGRLHELAPEGLGVGEGAPVAPFTVVGVQRDHSEAQRLST